MVVDRHSRRHYTHRFHFQRVKWHRSELFSRTIAAVSGLTVSSSACGRRTVRPSSPAAVVRAASASLSKRALAVFPLQRPRPEALLKERRLAKRREFVRVYDSGQKVFSRFSVLFFLSNDLPHSRIGITVTKKVGKANVRNRLKRWTREIYRRQREPLGLDSRSLDIVVNVKPNAAAASFADYSRDFERVLERVVSGAPRRTS